VSDPLSRVVCSACDGLVCLACAGLLPPACLSRAAAGWLQATRWLAASHRQLAAIRRQPAAIRRQPAAISRQPAAIISQLIAARRHWATSNVQPRTWLRRMRQHCRCRPCRPHHFSARGVVRGKAPPL
jgi:hypothetical protein